MSEITLNKMMVDYWTITSYCSSWFDRVVEWARGLCDEWEVSQRMQYVGKIYKSVLGSLFVGQGKQKGGEHYMCQIDGALAHHARFEVLSWSPAYMVKCTRVDFQITIEKPESWKQWDFLVRMRDKFGEGMVSYPRPDRIGGVLMQTVYVGRRQGSDRFLRVYMKMSGDGRQLLRLEVELKRRRSVAIYNEMCRESHDLNIGGIMASELKVQSQKDASLDKLYYKYIEGHVSPLKIKSSAPNTYEWIMTTCIPSIDRFIHDHGAEGRHEVESQLLKMCEYIVWRRDGN
jgi:Replication initiation factor.